MFGFRFWALAILLLTVSFSHVSQAKNVKIKTLKVDLSTEYGVLLTEIHFDARDYEVALKVEEVVKSDLIKVVNYFKYVPKNIVHINVDPYHKISNGDARTFPTTIINLYKYPPANGEHLLGIEDWITGVLFHEFIHIVHLDQTNGILNGVRTIFGSIATIPTGVVPRWFTEGVAVWGESHLMKGGRLNNPLFRKDLLVQFLKQEYCETIDCLDNPGKYPHQSFAYWAGAHFIEYLEANREGTVRCLVQNNSRKIPFFLNSSFRLCAGQNAESLFKEFRQSFAVDKTKKEMRDWGETIKNAHGSDVLPKGLVADQGKLFKVEADRYGEQLISYDLADNVHMVSKNYSYPIDSIVGVTKASLDLDGESSYIIAAFLKDPNFREKNKTWSLLNTETLIEEMVLPFDNDPSYVVSLGNGVFLTASFNERNQWVVQKQTLNLTEKTREKVEDIYAFGKEVNLKLLKKKGKNIYFKISLKDKGTALYVTSDDFKNVFKIAEGKEILDLVLIDENFLVAKDEKNLSLYEMNSDSSGAKKSLLSQEDFETVTRILIEQDDVIVLENRIKNKRQSYQTTVKDLKSFAKNEERVVFSRIDFKEEKGGALKLENVQSYPRLSHFVPYYWFLATSTNENLTGVGVQTQFSDPMEYTVASVSVITYPSETKIGGVFNLSHKFSSVSDLWSMEMNFDRNYFKSDFNGAVNKSSEGVVGTYYQIQNKKWTFVPGLFFTFKDIENFIASNSSQNVGISHVANYQAMSSYDFIQHFSLFLQVAQENPEKADKYIAGKSKLRLKTRFTDRFSGGIVSAYTKQYKSDFKSGVAFGGGTSTYGTNRFHEFYGIPYSNVYGNEIVNFRIFVDYNMWNIYRGSGFIPFYLKELHFVLGREFINADRIILDNKMFREKTVHSIFAGPRLKANIFYYMPMDVDLIFSHLNGPDKKSVQQVEFNFSIGL